LPIEFAGCKPNWRKPLSKKIVPANELDNPTVQPQGDSNLQAASEGCPNPVRHPQNAAESEVGFRIDWFGHSWRLLSQRGVYWPAQQTLIVSDTHFGKDATFRASSIAVPAGPTLATIGSLEQMLKQCQASRILILGDLFHARSSFSDATIQALDDFFARYRSLHCVVTLGNHDYRLAAQQLGTLTKRWSIECHDKIEVDGITFLHHPKSVEESERAREGLWCSGHLHPAVSVGGHSDQLGKLACFWSYGRQFVLPAVGHFTGSHRVYPTRQHGVWIIADEEILPWGMQQVGSTSPC
jgi:DNA ligase-associated metallophosphoesterase